VVGRIIICVLVLSLRHAINWRQIFFSTFFCVFFVFPSLPPRYFLPHCLTLEIQMNTSILLVALAAVLDVVVGITVSCSDTSTPAGPGTLIKVTSSCDVAAGPSFGL
jgi:hypothetical protein